MKLYIMCGIPESGKTTKANEISSETGATLIHHDSYYTTVIRPTDAVTPAMLEQVTANALADVKDHLENGEDVIYDAVNGTEAQRRDVLEAADMEGVQTVCVYMDTPLEVCESRDGMWPRVFAENFETPAVEEGFDELWVCGSDQTIERFYHGNTDS